MVRRATTRVSTWLRTAACYPRQVTTNVNAQGVLLGHLLPEAPQWLNLTMHYGQGALVGILRGVMAQAGLRGPVASGMFTVARLISDQILENATGVGAPPQTWPRRELAVDVLHKTVYGFATGAVADGLAGRDGPGPGQRHAALRPGRQSDIGPLPRGMRHTGRS